MMCCAAHIFAGSINTHQNPTYTLRFASWDGVCIVFLLSCSANYELFRRRRCRWLIPRHRT